MNIEEKKKYDLLTPVLKQNIYGVAMKHTTVFCFGHFISLQINFTNTRRGGQHLNDFVVENIK